MNFDDIKKGISLLQKISQALSKGENSNTGDGHSGQQSHLAGQTDVGNRSSKTPKMQKKGKSNKKDVKQSPSILYNPVDVFDTLKQLGENAIEAVKYCEEQETERERIRAQRDREIEIIRAQRDMIMAYLDKTFDERRMIFNKQFDVLDKAISKGDTQLVSMTLENINQLAASSPFKALADIRNVQNTLEQPGSTFDI